MLDVGTITITSLEARDPTRPGLAMQAGDWGLGLTEFTLCCDPSVLSVRESVPQSIQISFRQIPSWSVVEDEPKVQ